MKKYTYRNIEFTKIKEGWIFNTPLPGSASRWTHWCRFFEPDELEFLDEDTEDIEKQVRYMYNAIDRAYLDMPIYRYDIRNFNFKNRGKN